MEQNKRKTTKETGLTIGNAQLHNALNAISTRLSELQKVAGGTYQTNGNFKFTPNGTMTGVDIHKCTDIAQLLTIHSFLKQKAEGYNQSGTFFGLKQFPVFKWCGYTLEQWETDLKIRIALTTQKEETDALEQAKKELGGFLTREDQLGMLLQKLGGTLGFNLTTGGE